MDEEPNQTREYISYSLGTFGLSTLSFLVNNWLLYFYLPPDGPALVPLALYGAVIFLGRVISGMLTPLIGYWSDRSHHRWGRRLPFMLFAIVPMLGAFLLLWMPPDSSVSYRNLAFLFLVVFVFRIATAFYSVPYQSILPEIAQSDQPRIKISAWQSTFFVLGIMAAGLAGLWIESRGYRITVLFFAILALLFLIFPILGLRKRIPPSLITAEPLAFWRSFKGLFQNRAFVLFTVVWALYLMTSNFIQAVAPFLVTEVCQMREADTIYFYIPGVITSLLCFPVITRLSRRWGKARVYAASLLGSAIIFPATFFIGSWIPVSLRIQCASWAVLQAAAISGAVVLSAAFIAEIIDYDEKRTGHRREGVYFSVIKVLEQIFSGFAMLLLPAILLLGRSRTAPLGPLGVRLVGVVSGILIGIGFMIFLRYPLRQRNAVK